MLVHTVHRKYNTVRAGARRMFLYYNTQEWVIPFVGAVWCKSVGRGRLDKYRVYNILIFFFHLFFRIVFKTHGVNDDRP